MTIFPPILEDRLIGAADSSVGGLGNNDFKLTFSLPSALNLNDWPDNSGIKYVEFKVYRLPDMETWVANKGTAANVDPNGVLYLPVNKVEIIDTPHPSGYTRATLTIESALLKKFVSNFEDGGDKIGVYYAAQIRFNKRPSLWGDLKDFWAWRSAGVANGDFGEWSNTGKFFIYERPEIEIAFNKRLLSTMTADWVYSPKSNDPLISVKGVLYDDYPGTGDEKILDIKEGTFLSDGKFGAKGSFSFSRHRVTHFSMWLEITFITQSGVVFKRVVEPPMYQTKNLVNEYCLYEVPLILDDTENGAIGVLVMPPKDLFTYEDITIPPSVPGAPSTVKTVRKGPIVRLFRIDNLSKETVLIKSFGDVVDIGKERPPLGPTEWHPYPPMSDSFDFPSLVKDFTIEMGRWYRYFIAYYIFNNTTKTYDEYIIKEKIRIENPKTGNSFDIDEQKIYCNVNFNSAIFLTDREKQLKLRGNLNVSNLRREVSEQFVRTIGQRHPFFIKPSQNDYKTYQVQGVVTIEDDATKTFFNSEERDGETMFSHSLDYVYEWYLKEVPKIVKNYFEEIKHWKDTELWWQCSPEHSLKIKTKMTSLIVEYITFLQEVDSLIRSTYELPFMAEYSDKSNYLPEEGLVYDQEKKTEYIEINKQRKNQDSLSGAYLGIFRGEDKEVGERVSEVLGPVTQNSESGTGDEYGVLRYIADYPESPITSRFYVERIYRENILKWLTNGREKLIRSETEGNILGICSGVTLTPLTKDRKVFTLAMTITEVNDYIAFFTSKDPKTHDELNSRVTSVPNFPGRENEFLE